MVVDAVIHHWVKLIAEEEAGIEGFKRAAQWLVLLFYAEDGIPDLLRLSQLQVVLNVLTGIFERVGLNTGINNVSGILFHTC